MPLSAQANHRSLSPLPSRAPDTLSPAQGGVTRPLSRLPFRGEVQSMDASSLSNGAHLLAAVDSYGCCTLAVDASSPSGEGEPLPASLTCLTPPHESVEPGWAGVALAPGGLLATARGPSRTVRLLSLPPISCFSYATCLTHARPPG